MAFYGWVKPDGQRLAAEWYAHLEAAIEAGESNPNEAGWLHFDWELCDPVATMTGKQFDELLVIYMEEGCKLPFWVQDVTITKT